MAAAKIEAYWDWDLYDNHILIISKKRGKLNIDEVADFLRYEKSGAFQGNYVQIIRQLLYKMFGSEWRCKSYTYRCGKGSKSIRGVECTKAEGIQLQIEYEFYKDLWQQEMKLFYSAFIQKHRLFSLRPEDTKGNNEPLPPEQKEEMFRMSQMMDAMQNKTMQPLLEAAD